MNLSGAIIAPIENSSSGTSDIYLPNQSDDITGVAVDIGGSLSKVVYFSRRMDDTTMNGGRMHFERFHTHSIEDLIEFLRPLIADNIKRGMRPRIKATGGGAHKFAELFRERLGVLLEAEDEMQCLIRGLNFLLREVSCEVFSYDDSSTATAGHTFQEVRDPRTMFPYMLVNIGSGVSILKVLLRLLGPFFLPCADEVAAQVTSESTFERIGGTSLGGGTLWGLLSLLTDCRDYDEMLEMSTRGDNRNVDMLVGDIYGSDYTAIGLKATTIASSFGKMWQRGSEDKGRTQASQEDICKSALLMVSNNIAQIAFLTARYHQIETIYFGGSFIRGHADTMKTISYGVNFWSAGAMKGTLVRDRVGGAADTRTHNDARRARQRCFSATTAISAASAPF